jgi:hypothetical protein
MTMEIIRSILGGHLTALLISAAAILIFQTGRMRKVYPSMKERWGLKK